MSVSQYEGLFGSGSVGRPPLDEQPTGITTGDRKITEIARRRATRVLKLKHQEEFEELMAQEAEHLLGSSGYPVGVPEGRC
jgi:hypothetical protein